MTSPQILSPYKDIISANSYCFSNSNLASPNIFTFSPFYSNNIFNIDRFTFNNNNSNSFNSYKFCNSSFFQNNANNNAYINKNEKVVGSKIAEIDNKI